MLIADRDNKVRRLYDEGRVTYLIDRKGIIRFKQSGVSENRDFLKKLREIESGTE